MFPTLFSRCLNYRIGSEQVMALLSSVSKQTITRTLSRVRGVFQVRLTFIVIGPAANVSEDNRKERMFSP